MRDKKIQAIVKEELNATGGFLRLRPSWVARQPLKPGRRLGLRDEEYDAGERGAICERWLASETEADNKVSHPDEGLTFLGIEGEDILLRDAVAHCGDLIMGSAYAAEHKDLGRLAKIFDYESRIFFHYHQGAEDAARVGLNAKEESYYFPGDVEPGLHPETYFGVHPYIVREGLQEEMLLPFLSDWNGDRILSVSRAYLNVPGEGFHLPAGILHAPGTALTIELQEPSDVAGALQAEVDGIATPRELLFKDIPPEAVASKGERAVLDQLDWEANGDPFFYENHHTPPVLIQESEAGYEEWIFYNSRKYSGKRLVVKPGKSLVSRDRGVYNILVWRGRGEADGLILEGRNAAADELLVTHDKAVEGVSYRNTGTGDLEIFKFFGPGINDDAVPYLKRYP